MQRLVVAKQAARGINQESEPLLDDATKLAEAYEGQNTGRLFTVGAAIFFALFALLCLVALGLVIRDEARVRAFESEKENKRNQEAILRLLNEMGNLADGDLTVQASVTEDVTGAIADSINFTIEELRTLVKGINSATDQVAKATTDAQAISNRLLRSVAAAEQGNPAGLAHRCCRWRSRSTKSRRPRRSRRASRSSRSPPPKRAARRCRTRSPA